MERTAVLSTPPAPYTFTTTPGLQRPQEIQDILLLRRRQALEVVEQQGEEAELDLANTLRGLALVYESTGRADASRLLFEQARALYAKCNVQAGVAECEEKLSPRK